MPPRDFTLPGQVPSSSNTPPMVNIDPEMQLKAFKKALNDGLLDEAKMTFDTLRAQNDPQLFKTVNVTETSTLIEQLIKNERLEEASELAEFMLSKNVYPQPKIFRFLLNKMAAAGLADPMERIGLLLNARIKKEVSFDNRLCNAYISAGRGADFLMRIALELKDAQPGSPQAQSLKVSC